MHSGMCSLSLSRNDYYFMCRRTVEERKEMHYVSQWETRSEFTMINRRQTLVPFGIPKKADKTCPR